MNTAKKISMSDASRNFSDFINRVAYKGERFVLVKGSKVMAELVPSISGRKLGDLPEIFAALPRLDPTDNFEADLAQIRNDQNAGELRDPWAT